MKFKPSVLHRLLFCGAITLGTIAMVPQAIAETGLTGLTVDYLKNPIGLDNAQPRFAWQLSSDEFNVKQVAYQIRVFDTDKTVVWDSGKVESEKALGIQFPLHSLKPETTYLWQLDVWDNHYHHFTRSDTFQMSVLSHDVAAWDGAKWIGLGDDAMPLYSDYLPIFRLASTITLDKASQSNQVSMVFGANDPRLMNRNMNLNQMQNGHNDSYVRVELDTSGLDTKNGTAHILIYRVGYTQKDSVVKPLYSFSVPHSVINRDNRYQPHNLAISSVYGLIDIHLDDSKYQIPKPPLASPFLVPGVNINPMGIGSDYIAFPMLADVGFYIPAGQKASISHFEIRHYRLPSNAMVDEHYDTNYQGVFMPWLKNEHVNIQDRRLELTAHQHDLLLTQNPSRHSMPMLRTEFNLKKPVSKAQLYMTARGIYEPYLNGTHLTKSYFKPGFTEYDKSQPYQVIDVTSEVHQGDNALGVQLAEGWWSGAVGFVGESWNYFGDRQSLLAKLVVTYDDGTTDTIVTDPKHWKGYSEGPLVYASIFQGQVFDSLKAEKVAGWTKPGFDDRQWQTVSEVKTKQTTYPANTPVYSNKLAEQFIKEPWPTLGHFDDTKLVSLLGTDVKAHQVLHAQSVNQVRPGVFVYDMGQNTAAVPRITFIQGKKGQKITLRYGEMTYPDMQGYHQNAGMLMLENIRGANAEDIFTLRGGKQVLSPRFTYHGYRYLEITGIDKALPLHQVESLALSSVPKLASSFTTSNKKVNQLWHNISWSMRSNFFSIPTDTPARNERMGWNGDIQVFSPAAVYFANMPQFLRKHALDMRDTQDENGRFSAVSPMSAFGGMLWGSAGLIVPWESYLQYGDIDGLRQQYPAMKRYMNYLKKTTPVKAGLLGDWLSPEGAAIGSNAINDMIWTAYYAYDLHIMAQSASVLGNEQDSQKYQSFYQTVKAQFNQRYLNTETKQSADNQTGKILNTQASYAIPLGIGLIDAKNIAPFAQNLVEHVEQPVKDDQGIERPAYSLMTGFIGTRWILNALADTGHQDVAYKMLLNESYPSWLYSVDQGATTIWERLNSYTRDQGFSGNNSMNSFNHYSFGSVAAWMYRHVLGIQSDEQSPGYRHFVLAPQPDPNHGIRWAKGDYQSMYGVIKSDWKVNDGQFHYHFTIPANTSAELVLPAKSLESVTLNGHELNVDPAKYVNQKVYFTLGSGEYTYQADY